jgi:hypothetical protein
MLRYTGLDRESKGCFLQNTPPKTPKWASRKSRNLPLNPPGGVATPRHAPPPRGPRRESDFLTSRAPSHSSPVRLGCYPRPLGTSQKSTWAETKPSYTVFARFWGRSSGHWRNRSLPVTAMACLSWSRTCAIHRRRPAAGRKPALAGRVLGFRRPGLTRATLLSGTSISSQPAGARCQIHRCDWSGSLEAWLSQ